MGLSKKSHGRKTDQETQSPMLKIFKDIIQRDKDPEKTNLLKDHHEDRKKRHYSTSKQKKSESSSSERSRKTVSYKSQETRNMEYNNRPQSTAFQGERKESWWFWGDTKSNRDTRSCVSCVLKRLGGSEYFCVGCLLLIFAVSVVVSFLLVFRSVPTIAADVPPAPDGLLESDRLRRKMDALNEKKKEMKSAKVDSREKREWDNTVWKNLDGQGSISRTDFGHAGYNDLVSIDENGKSDLPNVLDVERMDDFQNNDKLREFFKKLVETDEQIRLLRKGFPNYSTADSENTLKNILERSKRSLESNHTKIGDKKKVENVGKDKNVVKKRYRRPFYIIKRGKPKTARNKRLSNGSEPMGYFIEKKKVLVQYLPFAETKKIPKCSHAPKESKSHETLLKHPFYKNSQRLDELLDQFIAKNLNEIMEDPYALELLIKNKKEKCKHPQLNKGKASHKTVKIAEKPQSIEEKIDAQKISDEAIRKLLQPLKTPKLLGKPPKKLEGTRTKEKIEVKATTTSENYDIVLSISTILSPDMSLVTTANPFGRLPGFRKLMQADEEDEESIGYEDLNEVLTEDMDSHDERDSLDRKKRDELTSLPQLQTMPNPPGVTNPNWKGAMPLYPDEINSMIKQAALNANKLVYLKNKENKDVLLPKDATSEAEDENDVQYIEEYFNSKYNRLVNMAQAYSDYGVLDGKRTGVGTDKAGDEKILEHRVKLSADGARIGNGLFGRLKKRTKPSEGIRFELRPTAPSTAREDPPLGMSKLLHKHLKIAPENSQPQNAPGSSMLPPSEMEFMYSPTKYDKQGEFDTKKKAKSEEEDGFMFSFRKGQQRSLMSIDEDDMNNNDEEKIVDIINEGETGVTLYYNFKATTVNNINSDTNENEDIKKLRVKRDVNFVDQTQNNESLSQKDTGTHNRNVMFKIDKVTEENRNLAENITSITSNNSLTFNNKYAINDSLLNTPKNIAIATKLETRNANGSVYNMTEASDDKEIDVIDMFMMLTNIFDTFENFGLSYKLNSSLNSTTVVRMDNYTNNDVSQIRELGGKSIGHRSRVLLSVDNITVDNLDEETTAKVISPIATESNREVTNFTKTIETNTTQPKRDVSIHKTVTERDKKLKNKTLVKRSVDDSNLIFWNDIYDDEYGVRVEPAETVRDKHSAPRAPGTWFKEKLRKLTDNLRKKPEKEIAKRGVLEESKRLKKSNRKGRSVSKLDKRDLKLVETDEFQPDSSFAALNANMKEVCKKAARAVQQTKNLEVKENTKESAASTTLMQQLVKLMTDLVDYQVQQKTCLQLPPDLQNFLEWLTAPNLDGAQDSGYRRGFRDDFMSELDLNGSEGPSGLEVGAMDSESGRLENIVDASFADKPTDHYLGMKGVTPSTSEQEEVRPEERSDCLGTLRAVQDLILKYEELSDEEKVKMAGIKNYLDTQLDYLEKYLASIEDFNNQKRDYPIRFKRNVVRNTRKHKKIKKRGKLKQKIKNMLKHKKHTKTTKASLLQTTVIKLEQNKHKEKAFVEPKFEQKLDPITLDPMKRNLKDYLKPIAESKKVTFASYEKYKG